MRKSKCFGLLYPAIVLGVVALSSVPFSTAATDSPEAVVIDGRSQAQCPVCKHNRDLACIDVRVDTDTPTATHDGKEYFFCTDECREDFLENPQKYTDNG